MRNDITSKTFSCIVKEGHTLTPSWCIKHRTRRKRTPPTNLLFLLFLVRLSFFAISLLQLCFLHPLTAVRELSTTSCFMLLYEIVSLIYSIDYVRLSKVNPCLCNSHVTYATKNNIMNARVVSHYRHFPQNEPTFTKIYS